MDILSYRCAFLDQGAELVFEVCPCHIPVLSYTLQRGDVTERILIEEEDGHFKGDLQLRSERSVDPGYLPDIIFTVPDILARLRETEGFCSRRYEPVRRLSDALEAYVDFWRENHTH